MKDLKSLNRVLLKLSGEALAGEKKTGFDEATVLKVAEQVRKIVDDGMQVAIVIGGGNFWRGRTSGEDVLMIISTEQRLTRLVCLQL